MGQNFGALALLGPSGISVRSYDGVQRRASVEPAALLLTTLGELVIQQKKRVALGLPRAAEQFPLLLSGLSVLGQTIERQFVAKGLDTRGGVLIVSPDLNSRMRYCDLFVKTVPLNDAYPGSRMKRSGQCVPLTTANKEWSNRGVCFFFPGLLLPEKIDFHPALVVIDLRYSLWSRRTQALADWVKQRCPHSGVLALYSLGDVETELCLEKAGYLSFPLDQAAVQTCQAAFTRYKGKAAGVDVDWEFGRSLSAVGKTIHIAFVENSLEVESLIGKIWALLREVGQTQSPNILRARWLIAALSQLPCPLRYYEEAAFAAGRPGLHRMITTLGYLSAHDTELGPVSQSLRALLTELYDKLFKSNPRAVLFAKMLRERVVAEEKVLVLTRDRLSKNAVKRWLDDDLFKEKDVSELVSVRACSDFHSEQLPVRSVLVAGPFPRRYRWIAWALPGENLYSVTYGIELKMVQDQLDAVFGSAAQALRARKRHAAVLGLGLSAPQGSSEPACASPKVMHIGSPAQEKPKFTKTVGGFGELAAELKKNSATKPAAAAKVVVEEDMADEEAPLQGLSADGSAPEEGDLVCIRLVGQSLQRGHSSLLLPPEQLVEYVRGKESDALQSGEARDLRAGDILLYTDEGERSLLFARVLDLAETQPEYCHLASYHAAWKTAMERLSAKYQVDGRVDYNRLVKELMSAGATISKPITLRFWLKGLVLGPATEASVKAVGQLSGLKKLEEQSGEYDRAFHQMRGIHQSLGKRLSAAIRRALRDLAGEPEKQSVDLLKHHLDLPIEEIAESIDMIEVAEVDLNEKKVPSFSANRLMPLEAK